MGKTRLALGVAVLAAGLVWVFGAPMEAQAQERFRQDRCTREYAQSGLDLLDGSNAALQREIAEGCATAAASARGVQAARARFYAGRAYNRLPGGLDEAIRHLEIAVNAGQDFENQFRLELRAARLELVQAYRTKGRIEAARTLLANNSLRPTDPAVAYQRALLILAELGPAGEESAFDALKGAFTQDDSQLRGAANDPVRLTPAEIRRGRSWLYRLGVSLGQRTLVLQARDVEQRRTDALRAIDYFRPAADAINAACADPQPLDCPTGIAATEQIGALASQPAPSAAQLSNAFFQLGIAHLKAAGLQETAGLAIFGDAATAGEAGRLDCFTASIAPDAASHFQNARLAFNAVTRRADGNSDTARDAHWGLGCTILASLATIADSNEQQRQLAQAVDQFRQAPNRPLTLLTLARAQVLQGQADTARASYMRALALAGDATQCPANPTFNARNRAELPSRIYLEMARTRYADAADGRRFTGSDLYSRTITDIRGARPGNLREAETELRCAIALNYNNAEARLTLGSIYLRLGSDPGDERPLDPPPFTKAGQVLQFFETSASNASEGRAEGLYLLSRRQTLIQQQRLVSGRALGVEGSQAVSFASQAYNTTQRPEFRRQACLSQTLFGLTASDSYCSAAQGDDYAESLLFEGMYWLRRGQREGAERMTSWSRSIQSFNRGFAEASDGDSIETVHPTLPATLELKELLQYGQRYVLRCTRLDYGDRETASNEVKAFFKLAGMPDPCGGAPR